MTYMLHVGLHPDHVGDLGCDDDHWEQWGEARPLGEAVHAYVETDTPAEAMAELLRLAKSGRDLVPMHWEHQKDTLAVVTPSDDWSEALLVVVGENWL